MKNQNNSRVLRKNLLKRKARIRKKLTGDTQRPRISLFRGRSASYAQVIDDSKGHTIASVSSIEQEFKANGLNVTNAKALGKVSGGRGSGKGVTQAIFERKGRKYHGRVKAFADGLREAGIQM